MTKDDVIEILKNLKVHPKHYAIGGELKDYAINVERMHNGQYAVYYSERGEKSKLKYYSDENEAYKDLLSRIKENLDYGLDLSY